MAIFLLLFSGCCRHSWGRCTYSRVQRAADWKLLCVAHVVPTCSSAAFICCLWICLCLEDGKYFPFTFKPRKAKPTWNPSKLLLATEVDIRHRRRRIMIIIEPPKSLAFLLSARSFSLFLRTPETGHKIGDPHFPQALLLG